MLPTARRCCRTLSVEDSHCGSMWSDEQDERAITHPPPHDELVQRYLGAAQARVAVDLDIRARSNHLKFDPPDAGTEHLRMSPLSTRSSHNSRNSVKFSSRSISDRKSGLRLPKKPHSSQNRLRQTVQFIDALINLGNICQMDKRYKTTTLAHAGRKQAGGKMPRDAAIRLPSSSLCGPGQLR